MIDYKYRSVPFLLLCDFKNTKHHAKQQQHNSSAKAPTAENVMIADSLVNPLNPAKLFFEEVDEPAVERVVVLSDGLVTFTVGEEETTEDLASFIVGRSFIVDGWLVCCTVGVGRAE